MSIERTPFSVVLGGAPVERTRATAALAGLGSRDVAAVRARAGSGKTLLLQRWTDQHRTAAYFRLDARHDAPSVFLTGLGDALGVCREQRPTEDDDSLMPRPTIEALLSARPPPLDVLVIDGVEQLRDPWVLYALDAIVAYASPQLRVVLSGRSIPQLTSLAVLRVRDDVVEIDDDAFVLDPREATALFQLAAERPADPALVTQLLDFSGGWVGGFRLAAKEWRSPTATSDEERLRAAMSPIRDYLFGDVVAKLPTAHVAFLVDTSVLDTLTPAMCDLLRGTDDSARILRDLERANAFVERLPGPLPRFRHHPLLRTSLAEELATTDPLRWSLLHSRAADLCSDAGDEPAAMRHLVAAGLLDAAWTMFHEHWVERYFSGEVETVYRWTDSLGATRPSAVDRASELAIALLMLGRVDDAEVFLVEVGRRRGDVAIATSGTLELARYLHAFARGSLDVALVHAARAKELYGGQEPPLWQRLRASLGLCFLYAFVDELDDAWQAYETAVRSEDPTSRVDAMAYPTALAHLALTEGRLAEAEAFADRALESGEGLDQRARAVLSDAAHTKAFVHLERNELQEAERYLTQSIEASDTPAFAHTRVLPRLGLARLYHALGRRDLAFRMLDECRHLRHVRLDRHFTERIGEIEGHLRIREGDAQGAIDGLPSLRGGRLQLIEVRALAALGEHERALDLLGRIHPLGQRRGVQVLLVLARCLPEPEARLAALREAVQLAESKGYLRILVDEKTWLIEPLLTLVPTWPTDYVNRVIDTANQELTAPVVPFVPSGPYATLSARELEVWRYLATPLSLGEVSRRLFISRNTMKTHVRNIYRKLGVATREEAVGVGVTEFPGGPPVGHPDPPR